MRSQVEVEHIRNTSSFNDLRTEWQQLMERSSNPDVFLTWEWLFAWWKTFGAKNELWLLAVRENGTLIGIAPLMLSVRKKSFVKLKVISVIGKPQCDTSGFLATNLELVGQAVCSYLRDHQSAWDFIELKSIPEVVCKTSLLQDLFENQGYMVTHKISEHYFLSVDENWETYYRTLSKNLRRNLKKRLRLLEELGTVEHRVYRGSNLHWGQFQTIFALNEKGSFPELYRSKRSQIFHQALYDLMNPHGWLQIELLYLDDVPIAFQYGYRYNNKYHDWRGAYDRDYQSLGIGKLLMMMSLEGHFRQKLDEIDFLRGAHSYKADWAPQSRNYFEIRIFNKHKIPAVLAYVWLKVLKPIIRRV